jgi:flagellar protein FlgJ
VSPDSILSDHSGTLPAVNNLFKPLLTDMSRDPSLITPTSYHDLRSLNTLRDLRGYDEKAALKAAAQQFEATFVNMLMKSMREANEVLGDDELLGGDSVEFYQTMHDEQLAATLSNQGLLGLADLMVKQLTPPEKTTTVVAPNSPQAFIETVRPYAERAAKKLGISPDAIIAQAALETGWGKSLPHNGNNCFGIKADGRWQGESVTRKTMEVEGGVVQQKNAAFRRYDNVAASFDDYVDFIQSSPRYQAALNSKNPVQFAQALKDAGYATDPHYVEKIERVLANDAMKMNRS